MSLSQVTEHDDIKYQLPLCADCLVFVSKMWDTPRLGALFMIIVY